MKTKKDSTDLNKDPWHERQPELTDRDIKALRVIGVVALLAAVAGGGLFEKHLQEQDVKAAELAKKASSIVSTQGAEIKAPTEEHYNFTGARIRTSEWVEVPATVLTEEEEWSAHMAQPPGYNSDYYGPSSILVPEIDRGARKGMSFIVTGGAKPPIAESYSDAGYGSAETTDEFRDSFVVQRFSAPGYADTDEDLAKNSLKIGLPESASDGSNNDTVYARMVMTFAGSKKETYLEVAYPLKHKEFNIIVNVEKKAK